MLWPYILLFVAALPILAIVVLLLEFRATVRLRRTIGEMMDPRILSWVERFFAGTTTESPRTEAEIDPEWAIEGPTLEGPSLLVASKIAGKNPEAAHRAISGLSTQDLVLELARSAARHRYSVKQLERLFETQDRKVLGRGLQLAQPADSRIDSVRVVFSEDDPEAVERLGLYLRDGSLNLSWMEREFGRFGVFVDRDGCSRFSFRRFRGGLLERATTLLDRAVYRVDDPTSLPPRIDPKGVAETLERIGLEPHQCVLALEGLERRPIAVAKAEVEFEAITFHYAPANGSRK